MPGQPTADSRRPALCIVNYNGARYLPATLARIRELSECFEGVVVVDDASTDESVELTRQLFPEYRLLPLPVNRGPGPARNAGLNAIGEDRVLFVDNDVLLGRQVIAKLSAALDTNPNAVLALPRVVSARDPERIEYDGGDAHVSGLVMLRGAGKTRASCSGERVSQIGSLISCCFLLDRCRWGEDPLFDEALGMYMDDHELGLRARMRGLDLLVVPSAVCLHGEGTPGVSIRETGRHTALRIRNTILNRWQVILKLYQKRTLVLLAPYLAAFEAYQFLGCLAIGWGREWCAAGRELLRLAPGLLLRRRSIQASRQRSDASLLLSGPHPFNPALAARLPVRLARRSLDLLANLNWALARPFLAKRRTL